MSLKRFLMQNIHSDSVKASSTSVFPSTCARSPSTTLHDRNHALVDCGCTLGKEELNNGKTLVFINAAGKIEGKWGRGGEKDIADERGGVAGGKTEVAAICRGS